MSEHLLAVVALPGRDVPTRIAGMLLPRDVEIVSMQFTHSPDSEFWWIQLTVCVPSAERLQLVTKRLNRLVDVLRVVPLEPDGHRRQSVYVRLRPDVTDLVHIGELARSFGAETLELTTEVMVLHLTAPPEHCAAFVAMCRRLGLIEVAMSAVWGFRTGTRMTNRLPRILAHASAEL